MLIIRRRGWHDRAARPQATQFHLAVKSIDMAARPVICCLYLQNTQEAAQIRQLSQQAAALGYTVQALGIPLDSDPRRSLAAIPSVLAAACRETGGPWLVLGPGCQVLSSLDSLLDGLGSLDVLVAANRDACFSHAYDPGCFAMRKSHVAMAWLERWSALSRQFAWQHRTGIGATLAESLLAPGQRLAWGILPDELALPNGQEISAEARPAVVRGPHRSLSASPGGEACATRDDASYVIVVPREATLQGVALDQGPAGQAEDFKEYAARYGVNQVWSIGVRVPAMDNAVLADSAIDVWQALWDRFPENSRLVVADYQGIFLRDPRVFSAGLDVADMVVAGSPWPDEVSTAVLGLRLNRTVRAALGAVLRDQFAKYRATWPAPRALAKGLAAALAVANGLNVIRLPAEVAASGGATPERTLWWQPEWCSTAVRVPRSKVERPIWVSGHGETPRGCAVA